MKKLGKIETPLHLLTKQDSEYSKLFGIRKPTEYHTHKHSGNRLWKNGNCSLCTQLNIVLVDERSEIRRMENEMDKMFLDSAIQAVKDEAIETKVIQDITLY